MGTHASSINMNSMKITLALAICATILAIPTPVTEDAIVPEISLAQKRGGYAPSPTPPPTPPPAPEQYYCKGATRTFCGNSQHCCLATKATSDITQKCVGTTTFQRIGQNCQTISKFGTQYVCCDMITTPPGQGN